jgi:opacity protein-like surface antigen
MMVRLVVLLLVVAGIARAQGPIFAGAAPVFEAGAGYSYTRSTIPSESTLAMNGILISGNADLNRHFGVKLELGYSRNWDAFNTGRSADILTYMGGPVFYPVRHRRFNVYAQALFGGARETGVNFDTSGDMILGFTNRFAWDGGAGVQVRISPSLSIRGGADYLRTSFYNENIALQGQNNLRTSVSLIYSFGRRE